MHCDPAPPHPPPGELYNAICPPLGGWPESMALLALMLLAILAISWLLGNHTDANDQPSLIESQRR